jgi:hypothetical protein
MTLTLDIPEELLIRAETYALAYGKSLDSLLLGMLEESLAELPPPPTMSREARRAYGQAQMRMLAAERGLDWDEMKEAERDQFLLDLSED